MAWTDDKIKKLKKLWEKGLSTSEIGKKLDVSKNAVVGKAHRIGLKSRPSPIKTTAKDKQKKGLKASKETNTKKSNDKKSKINADNLVKIEDLKPGMCRWPFGDPQLTDFHFCGEPTFKNKPYCLAHCAVAYTSPNAKKEKKKKNEKENNSKN